MIMAIIVFFLFIAFYFILRETEKGGIETEQKLSQQFQDKLSQVKTFVESCMDQVARKGLHLAGKQAGAIWKNSGNVCKQDGSLDITSNLKWNYIDSQYCVRYGILKSASEENINYPWKEFPLRLPLRLPPEPNFLDITSEFGFNNLPNLEEQEPSNIDDIEKVLELYINDNIHERCLNHLESFKVRFEINETTPLNTSISFRDSDILLKANYSVEIFDNATREKATLDVHHKSIPVRLKKLYQIAEYIVNGDTKNIGFNIKNPDLEAGMEWINDPAFEIRVDKTQGSGFDVVAITDSRSRDIDGNPFTFQFIRENRKPAIWYVQNSDYAETVGSAEYGITLGKLASYFGYSGYPSPFLSSSYPPTSSSYPLPYSNEGPFKIRASDPDEDEISVCLTTNYCNDADGNPINLLQEGCQFDFNCRQPKINFRAEAYETDRVELQNSACGISPVGKTDFQGSYIDSDLFITLNYQGCR